MKIPSKCEIILIIIITFKKFNLSSRKKKGIHLEKSSPKSSAWSSDGVEEDHRLLIGHGGSRVLSQAITVRSRSVRTRLILFGRNQPVKPLKIALQPGSNPIQPSKTQ